ncbi:hypothetical protein B566_EDAN012970 [Ephemera danica]|nr:hypothetical protein B566_EDAN012970 [Ephemera danica]
MTLEAQLMQSEVDQSSEGSVTGVVTGINHLDSLLHDEEVALSASLADHLDLSGSEDELQHELNWRDSELRQRRSQSGQGAVLSQTAGRLPTARSLSKEQSIWMLRRGATTVLLALAALTILFVLLPVSAAVVTGSRLCSWNPLRIEMPPGYGFQGHRRPPPV